MPRYNPKSKQAAEAESKKVSDVLASWPVAAGVGIFFCFHLPRALGSGHPWGALVYPGFFIAISFWPAVTHFAGRRLPARSLLLDLPVPIYMVLSTVAMFAFFAATNEPFYRRQALGSLIFTIPLGVLAIFLILGARTGRQEGPNQGVADKLP